METTQDSLFDKAMARYQSGEDAVELIKDFEEITATAPNHSAGWTCLAWLQLLSKQNETALRSARMAVKLNRQDPQARINLCLLDKVVNYVNFANGADHVKRRQLLKQPFGDKVSISGGKVDRHIVIFQILWGIWPRPATRGIWPFWFPSH